MSNSESILTEALLCQLASDFNGKKFTNYEKAIIEALKKITFLYPSLKSIRQLSFIETNEDTMSFLDHTKKELITVFRGQASGYRSLREAVEHYKNLAESLSSNFDQSASVKNTLSVFFSGSPLPEAVERCTKYCSELGKKYLLYKHKLCGQSVGGSISSEVAKRLKLRSDGFNPVSPFLDSLSSATCETSFEHRSTGDSLSSRSWSRGSPNTSYYRGSDSDISSFTGLKGDVLDPNSKCEIDVTKVIIGGIDLGEKPKPSMNKEEKLKLVHITGVCLDEKTSEINFLSEKNLKNQGVTLEDLAVPLLVYYDPNIKHKKISFSLDPAEPKNPRGPNLRKVFYPDEWEGKDVVRGTEFGEILFEADWLMKQLSMGINVKSMDPLKAEPFKYPKDIEEKGVKVYYDQNVKEKWQRLWLEIGKIDIKQFKMDPKTKKAQGFSINDLQVKINARQMIVGPDGKLQDSINQDTDDSCYKFAKAFSDCYDDVAKHYPIFEKLKKLFKAMALAEWMFCNRIPVDIDQIRAQVEAGRKSKQAYSVIVPALTNEIKQDTYTVKIFGGVNLSVGILSMYAKANKDSSSDRDDAETLSTQDETISNISMEAFDESPAEENMVVFPYSKAVDCEKCKKELTPKEAQIAHDSGLGNFCSIHHPYSCAHCAEILFGVAYIQIKEQKYHQACLKCAYCAESLDGKYYMKENVFMHQKCILEFTQEQKNFLKKNGLVSMFDDSDEALKRVKPTADGITESMIKYYPSLKFFNLERMMLYFVKEALDDAQGQYLEKYMPKGIGFQIGYSSKPAGDILTKKITIKTTWSDKSIEKAIRYAVSNKKIEEQKIVGKNLPEVSYSYDLELRIDLNKTEEIPCVVTLRLTVQGKNE